MAPAWEEGRADHKIAPEMRDMYAKKPAPPSPPPAGKPLKGVKIKDHGSSNQAEYDALNNAIESGDKGSVVVPGSDEDPLKKWQSGPPMDCKEENLGEQWPTPRGPLIGRRLNAALATEEADNAAWLEHYRNGFNCWFKKLPGPTQTQLGSCMGTLSLAIGQRLSAAWYTAQIAVGRNPVPAPMPTGKAEAGCEWITEGASYFSLPDLPSFPDFPASLNFELPAVPKLVPWSIQKWQEIGDQSSAPTYYQQSASSSIDYTQPALLGSIAGGGFAIGAVLVMALTRRDDRRSRGPN